MNKKLFWIVTIAVIVCLVLAQLVEPSFKIGHTGTSVNHTAVTHTAADEQRFREAVTQMANEYKGKNQELMKEFERKLSNAGNTSFQRARNNVQPFVQQVTKFKFCTELCYAMAIDKIRKTDTAMQKLEPLISSMIIKPCEEGQLEVVEALNEFLLKLQENDTEFKAGLANLLEKEHFSVQDLGLREEFLNNNMQLANQIQDFAFEKTLTAASAALEIVFIRSTYLAIKKGLMPIVTKIISSWATGIVISGGDGPLPIADIIGGTVAIGGTVWTCYDIHKVTKILPRELENEMTKMIDGYQREIRFNALDRAKSTLKLCEESSNEVIREIVKE